MQIRDTFIDRAMHRISTGMAIAGGLVLAAMAVMTVVSITGRSLVFAGLAPIPGDFELVEMGCAVAVFALLGHCHLNRGHVTVDILMSHLPTGLFNFLRLMGDLSITAIAFVICWRMWFGLQEKIAYGESTMILGAPLWLGYSLSFAGAVWMTVVGVYVLWRDMRHLFFGVRLP